MYLRIVGLHQLALAQEEFKVPPVHVRQQHHRFLSLFYADVGDGEQIPGEREKNSSFNETEIGKKCFRSLKHIQ